MNKLQIIRHGDLYIREMLDIIDIKSVAWPYDADSQFRWMIRNLRENDVHFLLKNDAEDKIVAYLNLVEVEAEYDYQTGVLCWGVGNVCARNKGNGEGREIMTYLNDYILKSGRNALLLCKKSLIGFYSKMGWIEIDNKASLSPDIHVMIFGNYNNAVLTSISRVF